jgi:hypothetical protein
MTATIRSPRRIVLRDHLGEMDTIDLPADVFEIEVPPRASFTLYGDTPDHVHHFTFKSKKPDQQIAVFVPKDECRWCKAGYR